MNQKVGQNVDSSTKRVEDLEIPRGPGREARVRRVGEGPAGVLLRLVDQLPGRGHLDQPRQAERAARRIPDQTFPAFDLAGDPTHLVTRLENGGAQALFSFPERSAQIAGRQTVTVTRR